MTAIWTVIASFVMSLIGPLVRYVVMAIGFGIVSYVGLNFVFDQVESLVNARLGAIPNNLLQFANLLGLSSGIKIILSTAVACASYKSLIKSTGTVWKKPGSPSVFNP